ncbi:MAG: hypothetical protein AAFV80_01300, partial [Bacteroidota bacterium]
MTITRIKKAALSFVFLLLFVGTQAQSFQYRVYNENEGIPSELVKFAVQDPSGVVWVASDYGLTKFDGKGFTTIQQGQLASRGKYLHISQKDELFISTDDGIFKIDLTKNEQVETVLAGHMNPSDSLAWYPKQ